MPRNSAPRLLPLWPAGAVLLAAAACAAQDADWAKLRARMVEQQIKARGIKDERVLQAMAKVPRHEFVPEEERADAYRDGPLPIGQGQTISQPYIVALMTEEAKPRPEHRVLEIGTGSGYQAAVLAELVKEVYTIELVPALAEQAKERLKRLGYQQRPRAGRGRLQGLAGGRPVRRGRRHLRGRPRPRAAVRAAQAGRGARHPGRQDAGRAVPAGDHEGRQGRADRRATSARSGSCRSAAPATARASDGRAVTGGRPPRLRSRGCAPHWWPARSTTCGTAGGTRPSWTGCRPTAATTGYCGRAGGAGAWDGVPNLRCTRPGRRVSCRAGRTHRAGPVGEHSVSR